MMLKYFSWGDIKGRNKNGNYSYDFIPDNYNGGYSGSGHTLTRDIPQGDATYDAVRANMGSPWKMPTRDQANELINNTTSTWTTINNVNGKKFISKTDSSKYIFLPAGGICNYENLEETGSTGRYLLTKYYNLEYSYILYFSSTVPVTGENHRFYGQSVRAIN